MKERNHAFDLLCGLCIVRMMLLHVTQACGFSDTAWWREVMVWSYYFMSFFFFKAGYFNKTIGGDSARYVADRVKRLLVPYVVWGAIGNAVYFFFVLFVLDSRNEMVKAVTWEHVYGTASFLGNVPCWFLLSFFVSYVAMHFISKVRGLRWLVLLFPALSWLLYRCGNPLWLGLNNVFFGIFLFFLGRVWRWCLQRMSRVESLLLSLLMVLLFCLLNVGWHGEYHMVTNTWEGDPWSVMACTVLSICGISGVLLSLRIPRVPLVNYIGQHSMVFFVAHYPMLMFYKMVRSANVRTLRGHWDDWTLLVVILFGVCLLLVPYVERVPWLSGRPRAAVGER